MLVYWALRLVQKRNQQRAHPWGLGLIGRISNRLWLIVQCAHFCLQLRPSFRTSLVCRSNEGRVHVQFNASGSGVSDFCHYSAIIDTCFELWMEVTYQMESWTLVRFRWWEVRG
jgi:hypothetical protein